MATPQDLGPLYIKMTDPHEDKNSRVVTLPGVLDLIGNLSVTSQFKLSMHLGNETAKEGELIQHLKKAGVLDTLLDAIRYDFLCSDASLPGISLNTSQEMGSYQGVIESFPSQRIYPPLDVTFYVDSNFKVIRLFEEWINFISPLYVDKNIKASPNNTGSLNTQLLEPNKFFRFRYPEEYKKLISISKFERNFRVRGTNDLRATPSVTYRLIDAYPSNVNSIPVTYEGSVITKTTVTFSYSRYIMESSRGYDNDKGL